MALTKTGAIHDGLKTILVVKLCWLDQTGLTRHRQDRPKRPLRLLDQSHNQQHNDSANHGSDGEENDEALHVHDGFCLGEDPRALLEPDPFGRGLRVEAEQ